MKIKLLTSGLLVAALMTSLSVAQIPTSGFDTWVPVPFQFDGPPGWNTNNSQPDMIHIVDKTTPSYAGAFAARLVSFYDASIYLTTFVGTATTDFAYNLRPTALNGFMKATVQSGDSLFISIALRNTGTVIGSGIQYFTSNISSYVPFSVPISYSNGLTPDSVLITLKAGTTTANLFDMVNHGGDTLIVDELSFDFNSGISTNAVADNINVYPNPATDQITVDFPFSNSNAIITVINSSGQIIMVQPVNANKSNSLNIQHLPAGLYLVKAEDGNRIFTSRFTKK